MLVITRYTADVDVVHEIEPERIARIRRETFDKMIDAGCFTAGERIQLLEGVLVQMSPQKGSHARTIVHVSKLLHRAIGDRADVASQLPFDASDYSKPEPDLALWTPASPRDPIPTCPLLVIEVSDTTLRLDRRVKAPIYGAAGVPEYWIINLAQVCVERHTQPHPAGYRLVETLAPGATLHLVSFPDVELPVADLLAAVLTDPAAPPA